MKAEEKKRLIILGAIAIIAIIVIVIFSSISKNKKQDGDVVSDNGKTVEMKAEDKTYAGLEFTDLNLVNKEGIVSITATVKNNNQTDSKSQYVNINVLDQGRNVIAKATGIVNAIPAGGSTTLTTVMAENCDAAKDIEITQINK